MVFEWMTVTQDSDSGTDRSVQLEYQAVITGEAAVCAALDQFGLGSLGASGDQRFDLETCPHESLDSKYVSKKVRVKSSGIRSVRNLTFEYTDATLKRR